MLSLSGHEDCMCCMYCMVRDVQFAQTGVCACVCAWTYVCVCVCVCVYVYMYVHIYTSLNSFPISSALIHSDRQRQPPLS